MKEDLELKTNEAWNAALDSWHHPSIPNLIAVSTSEEMQSLGETGRALEGELAFMQYPRFQTYVNLVKVAKEFSEDPQRGVRAVTKHEVGHRFCPYDQTTSIILRHEAKKELEKAKIPYSPESAAGLILNLFTDMCINTNQARKGDEDLPWAFQQLSKNEKRKTQALWKVCATSMKLAWNKEILPEDIKLDDTQQKAAKELAAIFERDFFERARWRDNIRDYARIVSPFLEEEQKDKETAFDDSAHNIPKSLDEKAEGELAKRLIEIGSDGLPTKARGIQDFKEIMAGFGQGDPKKASIRLYDLLSNAYNVMFVTRPFGRPRTSPFQPTSWTPSMGAASLDVDYSVQAGGGRVVPGVSAYSWNQRRREVKGGDEEVVLNLDIYLDSSMSMPNPINEVSLPVLAGFVVAKKAHRKGARVRSTNFSGNRQCATQEFTRDLNSVYENLVIHYNGGTVFPADRMLEATDPKQVLLITDSFLGNEEATASSITELRKRHKGNRVTVYALHPVPKADYLRNAGAEVIVGTSTDIFKRIIGKADEVYTR